VRTQRSNEALRPKAESAPALTSPGAAFAGWELARDIVFLNGIGAEKRLATPCSPR